MATAAQPQNSPPEKPAPRVFSETVPPHNLQAEQSVLGAMLIDRDAVIACRQVLRTDDFWAEKHRIIWRHMIHLHDQNRPIDLITLQAVLSKPLDKSGAGQSYFEAIGGLSYLTNLMNLTPTTANAGEYARLVADTATLRRLETAGRQIAVAAREAWQNGQDPDTASAEASGTLRKAVIQDERTGLRSVSGIVDRARQRIAAMGKPDPNRLELGLRELDAFAWIRSELISIHAPSNNGKSTLARQIALNVAKRNGHVAFFALETHQEQMESLLIAQESRLSLHRIRNMDRYPLSEEEQRRLVAGAEQVEALTPRLYFDYTTMLAWEHVRTKCLQLAMRTGDIALVLIDYTDLLDKTGMDGKRHEQQLVWLHQQGKILAKELNALVIFLDQAPIEMLRRADPTPALHDFEYAKGIPKACDGCVGLIIPKKCSESLVGKNRIIPSFRVPHGGPLAYNDTRLQNVLLAAITKGRFMDTGYLLPVYHHGPSGFIGNLWQRPWDAPEDKPGAEGTGSPVVERPKAEQQRNWTRDVPVDDDAPF